ncbi:unnamed protein product [Calypogeia fissa]
MESDDEIDEIISTHMSMIADEVDVAQIEKIEELLNKPRGGSRPGRSPNVNRDHVRGHDQIMKDYFNDNPTYGPHKFRRRYCMRKSLFLRIHDTILDQCDYFVQRRDAVGNPGLSSIQKMTAAMQIFATGVVGDAVDEYVRIGESTTTESFKEFSKGIVKVFGPDYLRQPTEEDVIKQMEINAARGWVGMFGSLDCTHWVWKNCPVALQGQYRDKEGNNSVILEAIATKNLWIWHAFIGIPGSNNDINVVDRSPLLVNLLNGVMPDVNFEVNGRIYNNFYLLTDGIYPDYSIFVKSITEPQSMKRKYFARKQEGTRKDVERCFGDLKATFACLSQGGRWWDIDTIVIVWEATIIMHNMIVEDQEDDPELDNYLFDEENSIHVNHTPRAPLTFARLSTVVEHIKDRTLTSQLKEDLVEHLWAVRGDEDN